MVRSPSHAGSFYPADAADLRRTVDEMLDWEEAPTVDVAPAIVVAPHAGYVYSGPVAAAAYRVLAAVSPRPRRFVLFGPSHFLRFRGLATPSEDVFATPLGRVAVDAELRDLVEANPAATRYDAAHHREHSLEVQLPFLQVVGGEVTMLPVLTGDIDSAEAAEVLDETLGSGEVFGVVSSDLSHYLDYETAAGRDRDTARAIVELRPQDLDGG
ncbi:MAG: AmmeMemoRadiSam system protein B, partial [Acidimicrobiia bacterium]